MTAEMRRRFAVADLTAMDLLGQTVGRLLGDQVVTADLERTIQQACPVAGRLHDDHLLIVTALSGQAANLLLMAADLAGVDPLTLLDRLRAHTAADAAELMEGTDG